MARITTEGSDPITTEAGVVLVTEDHVPIAPGPEVIPNNELDSSRARDTWLNVCIDLEFSDGTLYVWSGSSPLYIGGNQYLGLGPILEFTPNENSVGAPPSKVTVKLNNVHRSVRNRFQEPLGSLECSMRFVKSTDEGKTWAFLPVGRYGYTSNLRLQSEQILIDLVHPFELAFRRRPRYWSNEDQRRTYSSDSGFSMMRQMSEGVNIRFPYLKQYTKDKDDGAQGSSGALFS